MNYTKRFVTVWLLILMSIFAYICTHGAEQWHYYVDHIMTLRIAEGNDLADMLAYSREEVHPLLGYVFWHYWLKLFADPQWVKALSLFFSLGTLVVSYFIGLRLGGVMVGMCLAGMLAVNNAIIVQSFVVRNYTMMLLFLFSQFYFFLRFRQSGEKKYAGQYAVAGVLAFFTHISAVFATVIMMLDWAIVRWQRHGIKDKQLWRWLIVNAAIIIIPLAVYYALWAPVMHYYKAQSPLEHARIFTFTNLMDTLLYAPKTLMYLLPEIEVGLFAVCLFPLLFMGKSELFTMLRRQLLLALLLGTVLYGLGLYPMVAQRRALWIIPFVLPVFAVVVAKAVCYIRTLLPEWVKPAYQKLVPLLLLLVIFLMPALRSYQFLDVGEFSYTNRTWQEVTNYLQALPRNALVVTGRIDAILLAPEKDNIYERFSGKFLSGDKEFSVMPLYNTQLLYNSYYWGIGGSERLKLVAQALIKNRELDSVETLVFFKSSVKLGLAATLQCNDLQKEVTTFPTAKNDKSNDTVYIAAIPRKVFLDDLINPNGKSHHCLKD